MKRFLGSSAVPAHFTLGIKNEVQSSRHAIAVQRRGLKNLHQYPKARYKSLVKDTLRFSRNWWLTSGNNYELVDEVGHEREATENFGVYRDDSANDKYLLTTNNLKDLPPAERLNAIVALMEARWKVRDGDRGFDKVKLTLEALECFSDMKSLGQIKDFESLPEPDQDTFLQYAEACARFSQSSSHSHPHAVGALIRAAQICDEIRCLEKRDELLHVAEVAAKQMDRAYSFARTQEKGIPLRPQSSDITTAQQRLKQEKLLMERFKDRPKILEKESRPPVHYYARAKKITLTEMKEEERRNLISMNQTRPEAGNL
ncbi:hypothetical protein AGDE_05782 [Angomonas deanei]|nr:hypothetical protein AGDE_05782 [Angomonas deanei]|eukprot:EPY38149.1 hypothetical protein AGDE_05782 [Angomonas deanei]